MTSTFRAASSAYRSRRVTSCTSSIRTTLTGGRRTARARTTRHSRDSSPVASSRNSQCLLHVSIIVIVPTLGSYLGVPSWNSQYFDSSSTIYTIILLVSVCLSLFAANGGSQFLLDRLGRDISNCHSFLSPVRISVCLSKFFTSEKKKYILRKASFCVSIQLNEPTTRRKGGNCGHG